MPYLQSKLFPWHMAQIRRQLIAPVVIVGTFWETYWRTWVEVFRPAPHGEVIPFRRRPK
jgi:uncharacterized protein YqjF (DUF2071 family)